MPLLPSISKHVDELFHEMGRDFDDVCVRTERALTGNRKRLTSWEANAKECEHLHLALALSLSEKEAARMRSSLVEWSCAHCTFINVGTSSACAMCYKSAHTVPVPSAQAPAQYSDTIPKLHDRATETTGLRRAAAMPSLLDDDCW